MLDPEIDPFPVGSGQEPRIEDVLHEIVVEFFPIRAKEAPASSERGNNADDGGFFNIFQFFSGKSSPTPPEGATGDGKGAGRKVGRKADDVFADFTYEAPSALAQVRDDSVAE